MSQQASRLRSLIGYALGWLAVLAIGYALSPSPRRSTLAGLVLVLLASWFASRTELRALLRGGLPITTAGVVGSAGLLLIAQLGGLHRELYPFVAWTMYAVPRGPGEPITWVETVAVDCDGAEHPFRIPELLPDIGGQVGSGLSDALQVWALGTEPRDPVEFPAATIILEGLGTAYQASRPDTRICAMVARVGKVPPTALYRVARSAPTEVLRVALDR